MKLFKYYHPAKIKKGTHPFRLMVKPGVKADEPQSGVILEVSHNRTTREKQDINKTYHRPTRIVRGWFGRYSESEKKQGRNQRCACGSGLKYKKCCIDK